MTATPPRDRYYVLAILTLGYALNIADRFSISTLIEPIKAELHLTDTAIALLTGWALAVFYVTVGIPVAVMADRANRRNILALARAIWSGMTALCGLATNVVQLVCARFGVGIGEAGGTPPSTSILADKFSQERRPLALAIFSLGACLGAWLGSYVAGMAAQRSGWRTAFLILGLPGLLLALVVRLTVREPQRGALDQASAPRPKTSLTDTVRYVYRHRAPWHLILGGSIATLWSWGLMWWTPAFLQRSHHLTTAEAGALLGPMHLVAGTAGTLFAAWLMTTPRAQDPRFVARAMALLVLSTTVPSLAAYSVSSVHLATLLLWVFVPGVYVYIGPILGLLANVVPARMRATTVALLLFTANIANLVIAPYAVGALSDLFQAQGAGQESLRWALLLLAPTGLWGAWHLWQSGRTIRADQAIASQGGD